MSFCKNEVFHPSLFIHQFFAFLFIEFQFAITLIVNKNYIYFIYLDSIFFNHTLWVLVSFAAFTLNTSKNRNLFETSDFDLILYNNYQIEAIC